MGICGYGVHATSRGRIFAIILCAMSLIKILFGTALGIYGLWIMFNKETEAIYEI